MRKLVKDAEPNPVRQAALTRGARLLGPANLMFLDREIAFKKTSNVEPEAIRRRPHLSQVFATSDPQQRLAFLWFSARLPPDKLDELDKMCTPREFLNVRKLIDDAKPRPLQHAALKWGARELDRRNLGLLDESIEGHETGYEKNEAICRRPHLSDVFNLSTVPEKLALWWFSKTLTPAKLDELEMMIGRSAVRPSEQAASTSTGAPARLQDIQLEWIPETGLPHQVRRPH